MCFVVVCNCCHNKKQFVKATNHSTICLKK